MSRDTKRTWSESAERNGEEAVTGKMESNSSRESSSNRNKKSKPNDKNKSRKPVELETNQDILLRRQKQIDYGKNTVGYFQYTQQVPLDQRTKDHPKTPDKYIKYSRRAWDMLIKIWRKKLHEFDTENADGDQENNSIEADTDKNGEGDDDQDKNSVEADTDNKAKEDDDEKVVLEKLQ